MLVSLPGLFDNRHPTGYHIGIGLSPRWKRVLEADLLLVVGARLGEITTGGYKLLNIPKPNQKLVHVHGGAEELEAYTKLTCH